MRKKRKNPHAVALGRRGGKARLVKMTPESRQEVARAGGHAKAAKARARREVA